MSNDVKELLKEALSPSTGSKELREIWGKTTSIRVRKAVASNPNCNTATMAMAARLYIKDVIGNPSFEIQKIFNEDKIVEQIYDAYMDPQGFCRKNSPYSIKDNIVKNNVAKAMLVSPHLKDASVWENFIFPTLSAQEINRELKDKEVEDNLKSIVLKKIDSDLKESEMNTLYNSLMFLMDQGVIDRGSVGKFLGKLKTQSNFPSRKAYLNRFYLFLEAKDYPGLFKYIAVNNSTCLKHLVKEIKDGKFVINENNIDYFVWLYRDFLRIESEIFYGQYTYRIKKYGWSHNSVGFGEDFHSFYLSEALWEYVTLVSEIKTISVENIDLEFLFSTLERCGFDKDYGPYPCSIKFYHLNILTARNIICKKLLGIKEDRVFEFYMTCGLLWQDWYAKSSKDNLESQIIERMHDINASRQFRYYRTSTLDVFPTVRINCTKGIEHNRNWYDITKKEFPGASSKIDDSVLQVYIQRHQNY